jgi:hypothetical protein
MPEPEPLCQAEPLPEEDEPPQEPLLPEPEPLPDQLRPDPDPFAEEPEPLQLLPEDRPELPERLVVIVQLPPSQLELPEVMPPLDHVEPLFMLQDQPPPRPFQDQRPEFQPIGQPCFVQCPYRLQRAQRLLQREEGACQA